MHLLYRLIFPSTGNVHKTAADMERSWLHEQNTSPARLDQARQRLAQFVDFHTSSGESLDATTTMVTQCFGATPDSPRRQTFARQAAFQPAVGLPASLTVPESGLTLRQPQVPKLAAIGARLTTKRNLLATRLQNVTNLDLAQRAELYQDSVVWVGPYMHATLAAQAAYIDALLNEELWRVAFDEIFKYVQHGGRLEATGNIVTNLANVVRRAGILALVEETLNENNAVEVVAALAVLTMARDALVVAPEASVETLNEIRAMCEDFRRCLQNPLRPQTNSGRLVPDALQAIGDTSLNGLATYVASLQRTHPHIYPLAQTKLQEAQSDHSSISVVAMIWLGRLQRLLEALRSKEPSTPLSDETIQAQLLQAQTSLNEAIHGHERAKRVILSLIAVRLRDADCRGSLLALCGPHGNGKTTLVTRGLAPALNLPTRVIDMGGMKDSSDLLGNLPVYIGAEPGKLVEALIAMDDKAGVIIFDEIEKASRSVQDAIANLVDSSRNARVETSYFSGIALDLSRMTFAFTLNDANKLSPTLRARLEQCMIQTAALSRDEKMAIARDIFVPEIKNEVDRPDISFEDEAIAYLIDHYTDEDGARQLKGHIFSLVRDLSLSIAMEACPERVITVARIRASHAVAVAPLPHASPSASHLSTWYEAL